ncbi:DUF3768 domain-containing protein [Sphingomonadales bacterium 56]|uniref:DUF3768 domain-containing protein n=1 Tax=Sphingobium indicum TaxID=332055 RepID=A0A4Q4ISX1_9SPHN|nr:MULTISPECIES: DUF3768 domain-containing protein [Sphingobium]MBY2930701.1 DUF3768 domain-containing protein [Sphingomonadales bacterium 56]MBY2960757.1 DUF3768 domain-containing protein [Sphingomonadales bacterium 58]NYI25033.1 hypothetical protein [Sphingobium indicum]RYL96462.1 DUF3768 domain-containing protein [Sphingobium indicum]CAD7341782.1 hypothetical protein SPHS6_03753 [Sphingobium sp. S6]
MAETRWTGLPQEREPQKIAELNDWLRANLVNPGHNRVVMTAGIAALIGDTNLFLGFHRQAELLRIVRDYNDFSPANDPHREHDMGVFEFEGTRCFWKIDYYDQTMSGGAENPADAFACVRVLTILRADEW